MAQARIWYQSFVHPVEQAPYMQRLQALLDSVAAPGVRFEVRGLDPPDHAFHPLTEFRCAAQVIRHALEAEQAGYDRVAALWKKLGVGNPPKAYPSIALGVFEATPLEIATEGRCASTSLRLRRCGLTRNRWPRGSRFAAHR